MKVVFSQLEIETEEVSIVATEDKGLQSNNWVTDITMFFTFNR